MTIGLSFKFLAGRYHATPWNHQVNEGVVEWPPSPWRILRALVSAYYRLSDRGDRPLFLGLLTQLAEVLPCYRLPPYTATHTRHYMPVRREGENKTTLVFDTFYAVYRYDPLDRDGGRDDGDNCFDIWWEGVNLSESEEALLQQLCTAIAYLGRAESWVKVEVLTHDKISQLENSLKEKKNGSAIPVSNSDKPLNARMVKVLTPLNSGRFADLQQTLEMLPKPKKRRGKKPWQVPQDLLSALEVDIGDLHGQGWNGIPGADWASYWLWSPSPQPQSFVLKDRPNFALFQLVTPVLPPLTQAIAIGDRVHRSLTKISKNAEIFSGRNSEGEPLRDHQHAFFLPEDSDRDGKIDRVIVWARQGFNPEEVKALAQLRKIWGSGSADIQLVLLELGKVEKGMASPLAGKSKVWHSVTPLIFPRYVKKNGKNSLNGQIYWLLEEMTEIKQYIQGEIEECVEIEPWPKQRRFGWDKTRQFYGSAFWIERNKGSGLRGSGDRWGFTLHFKDEVQGPIALGYGAHFGLGLFAPGD